MQRRSLLLWCIGMSTFLAGTGYAQDVSSIWNAARRVQLGLDKPFAIQKVESGMPATMNPLSPPNTADVQVFNPSNFWQSENSIGVNFSNASQLMVSTNGQIPGSNPVVEQTWAFSTDGGYTWPASLQSENIPPGIVDCIGDPVAFFDRSGRAYFCTLGQPGGIFFVSTTNFGATWSARSNADNLNSGSDDKQHAAADYSGTFPNNIYTAWTDFGIGSAPIQFARSTNQGTTWQPRVQLAIGSNRGQGAHIAIGPNGEVYVIWGDYTTGTQEVGLGFAKSTDGGATFGTPVQAYPFTGIRTSNGGITELNGTRATSFPSGDADRSNGPRRGWIYTVHPELVSGQADVFLHRSTDGGATWSSGIQVNGPDVQVGKWQWMASVAVDPTSGGISVSYYSMDSVGTNFMTNRYMAYSADGGNTWDRFVVSDVRALWAVQGTPNTNATYNGDYYETTAMNGKAWPVWTDRRLGAAGSFNRAYVQTVIYSEFFGWARGTITNLSGGSPLSGVAVDFTDNINQQGSTSDGSGFYLAGAKVDTPGTTRSVTLRARKFGFRDTLQTITLTRNDTLTRNFAMTPVPNGTLVVRTVGRDSTNIRSGITVLFNGGTVASGNTDSLTGIFSTVLPLGSYDVLIDPPSPYGSRRFNSFVITTGSNPLYVVVRAVVENSPSAMRDTLAIGQVHAKTLALTNTTASDTIPYRLGDDNVLARTRFSRPAVQPRKVEIPGIVLPKGYIDPSPGRKDSSGGPDGFGYRFIDSDSPGGPVFNWFNIDTTGRGTAITFSNLDDGTTPVPLPFPFPFYGNTYSTTLNVCTNGWMSFTSTTTEYSNTAIPNTATPNNAIYPFWDDLNLNTSGTVKYYYDSPNTRFIVQYTNVAPYSGTGTGTFQVILYPSGQIIIQYQSVTYSSPLGTVGLENADGTVALQVAFNTPYIHNNLATRFYLPDAPWVSENPTFGSINPGATQNITVTFDATGLLTGTTYNGKLILDLVHPDVTGSILIPASLKVNAATNPVIILGKTSLAFPATEIGTNRRDSLAVRNGGAQTLVISSMTSTNPRFAPSPTSASILPGDSIRLRVTYTGTAPAHSDTGRVIILSNDPLTPRTDVMLTGSSFGVAHVVVRPDTFYFSRAATPDTTFSSFRIYSTGTDTLRYTVNEANNSPFQEARAIERSKTPQHSFAVAKGAVDPNPGERDSSGGPDAFGYRWIDSDTPGGPAFNWVDISTVGTQITTWTGTADDGYAAVPFPFPFSFYGTPYSGTINVCTNGFLSFTSVATTFTNLAIPSTSAPLNGIFPFWDDLYLITSGAVYYYNDVANNRFIVEYLNVPHFSTGGPYTFEVIFKPDGTILYQYQSMDLTLVNSSTIGVQNADGTVALQVVYNNSYLHNSLALLITSDLVPWMSTNRTQGAIAPGDSQSVSLRIHPAGLTPGLYTGFQKVRGNTPDTSANVRVHLNVVPGGNSVTLTSPNGGEIVNAGSSYPITWTKTGSVDTVRLEYSTTGSGGPWTQITPGVPARPGRDNPDGTFSWSVPGGLSSTNSFIRVSWKSNPTVLDINDAAFTIQTAGPTDTTIIVSHNAGWSLISLPVKNPVPDDSAKHIFPTIVSRVFRFSNGYIASDTMLFGYGYWGKFPAAGNDPITGTLVTRDSISVVPGWNLLGSISRVVDTSSIVYVPPGIKASNWFGYSGSGYGIVSQIIPGKGYFVKFSASGKVVLANPASSALARIGTQARGLDVLNTLTIKDSRGMSQTLYFGPDANKEIPVESFAMPPAPPVGAFDARFQSSDGGSMVQTHPAKASASMEFPVAIQSDAYPLTVTWKVKTGSASYQLADGLEGRLFHSREMVGEGSAIISSSDVNKVVVKLLADEQVPTEYALSQNYPNPFNPTTTIKYDLPVRTHVTLKVYNVLGQEVVTLMNDVEEAGYKSVVLDAGWLASGMYFYQLQAGSFTSVKKLLVLK